MESAGKEFAWITAGFYTSILLVSFLDPLNFDKISKVKELFSNRTALILAAIGGFGGFAGVGGVAVIIVADLIDIATTVLTNFLTQPPSLLQYFITVCASIIAGQAFYLRFLFYTFFL